MTNNTNINESNKKEKIFILEWKSAELKDKTMRYENFKVVVGSEQKNLLFYSTFFVDNFKFKKGEFYQLSTPGNFVEDTSGNIPGSFDTSGIIQGIDNGGYEFEKVVPALLIKELWEEKEEMIEKLNISEGDLEQKRKVVTKVNQELLVEKKEHSDLRNEFSNLQTKKEKVESEKKEVINERNSLKVELQEERENVKKKEEELVNSRNEVTQLQNQLNSLQTEKNKIENEWFSPEKKKKFLQDAENLKKKLEGEKKEKQRLINQLGEISNQGLKDNIQTKLEEKKKEQEQLKLAADNKLGNQTYLLENLLEKQEGFDLAVFEDVNKKSSTFLRVQEKLQEAKNKLVSLLTSEEIEEFCQTQAEISKLEIQQKQWKEMEEKQAKEEQFAFVGTPPTSPR